MLTISRPASLPHKVYSLRNGDTHLATRRPTVRGLSRTHIVVFERRQDAKAIERLFTHNISNLDTFTRKMDDSWRMPIQTRSQASKMQLHIAEEDLSELMMQLGFQEIFINIVYSIRIHQSVIDFNVHPVPPDMTGVSRQQMLRQHYDDLWDRA